MFIQLFCAAFVALGTTDSPYVNPPESIARVTEIVYRDRMWISLEQIPYDQIASLLPDALRDSRKLPTLWSNVLTGHVPEQKCPTVYDVLMRGLVAAHSHATDRAEGAHWASERWNLHLRMLKDRVTRKVYSERKYPDKDGSEYNRAVRILMDLQGTRAWLVRHRAIDPSDWGIQQGLTWSERPGSVSFRNGAAFVDLSTLRELGLASSMHAGAVVFALAKERVSIPIVVSLGTQTRSAFRSAAGTVYIPILELRRQAGLEVEIIQAAQMIWINLLGRADKHHESSAPHSANSAISFAGSAIDGSRYWNPEGCAICVKFSAPGD